MECPKCSTENAEQAEFCLSCGAKLALACPQCGTELPAQARFCFACGTQVSEPTPDTLRESGSAALSRALERLLPKGYAERLLAERGKVGKERRMVTMLFSDVKGSTQMAENLDPEEWVEIMEGAFEVLIEPIYRYEGTVARLMGDAILAFFGAPLAHEDDPERACRAALEIIEGAQKYAARLEERGIAGFNVRVGINTGLVVVGEVGSDLRVEYTAMGDAVNLAARMEQAAPPGGILITYDTYRHVRGVFDVQALEPMTVKGKAEPIQVYGVQRAKPRAFRKGTRGVEGIETRMIGREAELKRLQDASYTAMEDSERQVVTIVSEAGVGKSRLLYEFDIWSELQPELFYFFKGRASQEMQNLPYALIRDLFSFRFQIQDSDRAEVVREKMEQGIGEALGEDEQSQMKAHFMGQLLGFDFSDSPHLQGALDDAKQIHDRALIYLSDYFKAMAAQNPVLILLEDLHWADDSSLDVLNHLALTTPNQRLLTVCAARPVLFERRPHWGEGQPFHTRLELQPLSKRDSRRLVAEILQKVDEVPPILRDLVVSGAEGNPFYIEELIKMLIEDGVIIKGEERWQVESVRLAELRVPPSLTGVLQARLDSLPSEERTTLQQASVVGRLFWDVAVVRIAAAAQTETDAEEVRAALSALRGREMVFRRETSAFEGAQEYLFKHVILREVTYESVLKRVRRVYHSLVAEWLMEQSGERVGEYTGLIADHLALAGRAEEAAAYLRRAGEQAAAQFANAEAVNYFSRALELSPESHHADRYALLLAREQVYDLQGAREAQAQDLAPLQELAETLNDDRKRAEVALRRANYATVTGDYRAAITAARAAVRLGQVAQDVAATGVGYLQWGRALWRQGDYEAARTQLEQALALARTAGLHHLEAESLRTLGTVCVELGDHARARAYYEQSLHICREIGDRRGEGAALNNLGIVSDSEGDYAGAWAYYDQSLRISQEMGDRFGECTALSNLGYLCRILGDIAGAQAYYEQALRISGEIGSRYLGSVLLCNLGLAAHNLGDHESAREYSQQSLQIAQQIGHHSMQGSALTFLGHALLGLNRLTEAAEAYRQALDLRHELGERHLAMESLAGLARVNIAQGDLSQARAQVEEILAYLKTGTLDGTEEPFRVYLTCYQVLQANQDPRAREILTTAHTLLQEQAARITDEETRRSFLENLPYHREIVREFAKGE